MTRENDTRDRDEEHTHDDARESSAGVGRRDRRAANHRPGRSCACRGDDPARARAQHGALPRRRAARRGRARAIRRDVAGSGAKTGADRARAAARREEGRSRAGRLVRRGHGRGDPALPDCARWQASRDLSGAAAFPIARDRARRRAGRRARPLRARVERLDEQHAVGAENQARFIAVKAQAQEVLALSPGAPEDLGTAVAGITSPSMLADMVATFLEISAAEKQELLETLDVDTRLSKVGAKLAHLAQVLELSNKIRTETRGTLDKAQREYYLREQLGDPEGALGEAEAPELDDLKKALADAAMPPEVEKESDRELERLERMNEASAEYTVVAHVPRLDPVDLPWTNHDARQPRHRARAHRSSTRTTTASRRSRSASSSTSPCASSRTTRRARSSASSARPASARRRSASRIARALGRKFVRISLGGVHDEAEIRGHRRTYVGALPGQHHPGHEEGGHEQPGLHARRDRQARRATSAAIPRRRCSRCSTPSRTTTFADHYLEVPFDLSQRDVRRHRERARHDPGAAARPHGDHRAPRLHAEEKLADRAAAPDPEAARASTACSRAARDHATRRVEAIIDHYTREAGVRNLERELAARHPRRRGEGRRGRARSRTQDRRRRRSRAILGAPQASTTKSPSARASRASRRASRGRRSAARSSSSRRRACPARASCSSPGSSAT